MIVRMYNKAFMWYKNGKQSIVDAMKESHCTVETGYQRQGESIALNPEGTAYYRVIRLKVVKSILLWL